MRVIVMAACAALLAMPAGAWAQSATQGSMEKSGMKGSPNADGFGKGDSAAPKTPTKEETPSASNLKGSPNANGFGKQQ